MPRRDSAFALPRHCVKHGTVEFVDRNVISEQNWTHSPAFKAKVALAAIRGEERHRVIRPIRFLSPAPLAVTTQPALTVDLTYIPDGAGLRLSRALSWTVQSEGLIVAATDHHGSGLLHWGDRGSACPLMASRRSSTPTRGRSSHPSTSPPR